jgi:hypothetical protein
MRSLPLLPAATAARTDEWVAEHFPVHARWVPELESRDLLVFSHYTLHRTQVLDLPIVRRLSCEWRVTQHPSHLAT